ncbi:hypothetical protein GOZ90_18815 [Agrobacterium vitis]|uniref:Sarcosine oxidase subunit gamma n=1 Tax=Agrobacterium vitis TaxID=373 RepID=A0A6L6VGJ0_AGRVI|nr:hypothetical protein [Agrobacterium vitis]MUZ74744.1 hypothetical protein [Agrobacterium vitis]
MADIILLPIQGVTSEGHSVRLTSAEPGYLTQLTGWDNFDIIASEALSQKGLSVPPDCRSSTRFDATIVWRIAPDRILIWSNAPLGFNEMSNLAILDLSDARYFLKLSGPGAVGLLSRVSTLNFSRAEFLVGNFAQTVIHEVGVLIDRQGAEEFTLLIPTTYATSIRKWLVCQLRDVTQTNNDLVHDPYTTSE